MKGPYERPRYLVRAYAGRFHPAVVSGEIRLGELVAEITCTVDVAKEAEVQALRNRREAGHTSRIVVIDREGPSTTTVL